MPVFSFHRHHRRLQCPNWTLKVYRNKCRRRTLLFDHIQTKERRGRTRNGRAGARPSVPDAPAAAGGPRDMAGLAEALASMERRLAEMQARLDGLDASIEARRRTERELDIQIAIRKGALELLGKEPGTAPENLTSREKTILVKTVSETMGVTARSLLSVVGIARSTYHYQVNAMKRPDKDASLLELVREAFGNSKRRYGYKRIHLELKSMGVGVSAKRVMRLMTSHGLVPLFKSAKRYSSYKGELTKAPKNLVNRDFHAERPNMLWVTDLTEFSISAGKAYLSPVIDCYDGLPVAWTIGTSPNAELVNGMLTDACSTLKDGEKPIVRSDRSCHYRWSEWIRIRKDNNLTRSTGAKEDAVRTTPPRKGSSAVPGRSSSTSVASPGSPWTGSSACSTSTWSGTGTGGSRRSSA